MMDIYVSPLEEKTTCRTCETSATTWDFAVNTCLEIDERSLSMSVAALDDERAVNAVHKIRRIRVERE